MSVSSKRLRHQEERAAERKESGEAFNPSQHPSPSIFSLSVPLLRQTYFQSPGKSVDSSLFPLLGLLAGYPFQQT